MSAEEPEVAAEPEEAVPPPTAEVFTDEQIKADMLANDFKVACTGCKKVHKNSDRKLRRGEGVVTIVCPKCGAEGWVFA